MDKEKAIMEVLYSKYRCFFDHPTLKQLHMEPKKTKKIRHT